MFVPLSHAPGHAQCDYGEAVALITGVERKVHYFVLDLPHSDGCFVKAYPAETTEAFLDGHVSAFALLGGAPQSILYDNTKLAVARILGVGSGRGRSPSCSPTTCSRTGSDDPARAMTKGRWRGWWATRGATSWCRCPGWRVSRGSMLTWSKGAWSGWTPHCGGTRRPSASGWSGTWTRCCPCPPCPMTPATNSPAESVSLSLVRYRTNDYSAPVAYGHREVLVRGYVDQVVISCGAEVIARHPRSYEQDDFVFDPIHYLPRLQAGR